MVRRRPAAAISGRHKDETVPIAGEVPPPESRACPVVVVRSAGCRGVLGGGVVRFSAVAAEGLSTPDSPYADEIRGDSDGVSCWCGATRVCGSAEG